MMWLARESSHALKMRCEKAMSKEAAHERLACLFGSHIWASLDALAALCNSSFDISGSPADSMRIRLAHGRAYALEIMKEG